MEHAPSQKMMLLSYLLNMEILFVAMVAAYCCNLWAKSPATLLFGPENIADMI